MKRKWKDTKRKLDQVQAEKVMQVEGCIGHWAIAFKIRIREGGRGKFFPPDIQQDFTILYRIPKLEKSIFYCKSSMFSDLCTGSRNMF